MRIREIADTPEKGQKRYRLYKDLINRYKFAIDQGFYLEAIALMESIITDRLESALIYYGVIKSSEAFKTMGSCLSKADSEGIITDAMCHDLKVWKDSRNHALHEMAKIEEGDDSAFEQRIAEQRKIAEQGYELFKSLKKELG